MKQTRPVFLYVIVLLIFSSCEENDGQVCGTIDPVNELEWISDLTQQVDESCGSVSMSLFQATYGRRTVFYLQITDPLASVVFNVELYNCEGVLVTTFEGSQQDEFYEKVKQKHIIYSCAS